MSTQKTPREKPPRNDWNALWERHSGCLPILATVVATIVSSHLMYRLTQFLHICSAYGYAAWAGGLRVIDKQGHLSDGGELSVLGHAVVFGGTGVLTMAIFAALGLGLPYLRMKLHGERLAEQLARWKAEHEQPG